MDSSENKKALFSGSGTESDGVGPVGACWTGGFSLWSQPGVFAFFEVAVSASVAFEADHVA